MISYNANSNASTRPVPALASRDVLRLIAKQFEGVRNVRLLLLVLAGMRNRGYPVKFTGENRARER